MLGLCTGLLPSVLTATATDLEDLISLGPRIVCVALRLALDVHRRSRLIASEAGSWSRAVRGVPLEELQNALDLFEQTDVGEASPPRCDMPLILVCRSALPITSYTSAPRHLIASR